MRTAFMVVILACLMAAPFVAGNGGHAGITYLAKESGCASGKTFCITVEGSVPALNGGSTVHLTYKNQGASPHNLYVTTGDKADPDHRDTPAAAAIARIEEIPKDGMGDTEIAIPAGAETLYFWCEVSGHEILGMWDQQSVSKPATGGDEDDGAASNGSPGPAGLLVLAGLGVAALVAARRRA